MPKYFVGEIMETGPYDLIKPFLEGKRSGMIAISGKNAGEIHIEGGEVVHAKTGSVEGEEAFLAMMEWTSGKATFDWEVTAKERTVPVATGALLLKVEERKEDWKKVKEMVPSSWAVFKISTDARSGDVRLGGDEWRILSLASAGMTVADMAKHLDWDLYKTSKAICDMVGNGLLARTNDGVGTVTSSPVRYINGEFFSFVDVEFKKIMGPIAPIIIDDKLMELGETRDAFPEDRAAPFVDALALEIPDVARRMEFTGLVKRGLADMVKPKV